MKRNLIALFLTGLAVHAFAAVPPGLMNYQGVLRNASNAPQSGTFDMEFAFYDDTDPDCGDGTLLLTDSHLAAGTGDVTVTGGLFNTTLGGGALTVGVESTLAAVFGNHSSVFMEVRIEGGGGALETLCPRIRVVSAGYSLSADQLDGLDSTSFINTSASAQTKLGNLTVADLEVAGNNLTFGNPGAELSAAAGGTTLTGGDAATDDLLLRAGPDVLGGGIFIFGQGNFNLHSGGGPFQFVDSANVVRASLSTAGSLQLDGDLDVDGNNITFGNPGASIAATASTFTVTGGDAASDDLILRAASTGTSDGQILINGGSSMILTSGNGIFNFLDGPSGVSKAAIDASGNLQLDGILDEDGAITLAGGGVATITGGGGFTFSGTPWTFGTGGNLFVFFGTNPNSVVNVNGDFGATGTKSFVQNHPTDEDLSIYYVALEGDEAGTYTRGSGHVSNGVVRIPLGETFALVTNPDIGLTAQVTPRGEWADLYVESVTTKEIVVRSRNATVPAAFDYIVYGLRIGHEDFPVIRKKTMESTVPSESAYARKYYADRPELSAYSPLARFRRMEADAGIAHREPTDSRALRQAIGEHELDDHVAVQGPVEAASAPIATADDTNRKLSSSNEAGGHPSLTAGPSAAAVALPIDTEGDVDARSSRPSADHLESFVEVAEAVETGDVLVIDAEKPGVMSLARTAADSAVFGVVAAESGVVLSASTLHETAAIAAAGEPLQVPVALSGIVLCKVDARLGPIRAGDLLTTSTTPGHAMRAQNPRAGTIVGKALESLGAGTARIKVLVMLH